MMESQSRCRGKQAFLVKYDGEPYCVDSYGNYTKQANSDASEFIKKVRNEARILRDLEERERAQTAENPRIRYNLETSDICIELQKQEREDMVKERRSRYLQNNYEDLRNLKLQILLAHSSKYQAETSAEFERLRKQAFENKKAETEKTRLRLLEELKHTNADNAKEREKKQEMLCDLKEQIEYKEYIKGLRKVKAEEEKEEMLLVAKKIEEEKAEEVKKAQHRKSMTKQMINDYLKQREEFRRKTREESVKQNEKSAQVQAEIDGRNAELKEKKRVAWERKVALSDEMGAKLDRLKKEQLFQESQLSDLLIDEKAAKEEALEKKAAKDLALQKTMFNRELQEYLMGKQYEMMRNQRETENATKERMQMQNNMRKEEEDLRAKSRQTKAELREQILYMIQENKLSKLNERQSDLDFMAYIAKIGADLQAEIRAERMKLLKAEPVDILKHLPSRSITSEERKALNL